MINIILLSSDNINAQTGAAKFVRLFIQDSAIWENAGIRISCFSNSDSFSNEISYRKSFLFKIKQLVKNFLSKSILGKRISFINYQLNFLGYSPVNKIANVIDNNSVIILNDIRVAYNYYKIYRNKYKSIFIMHNSGDMLSMLNNEIRDKKIKSILEDIENSIIKYSDKLIFVSEVARNYFINKHSEIKDKTKTIYIGFDKSILYKQDNNEQLKIVTVGTVCERKNQILAIKAIESMNNGNLRLTIVGGGPKLFELQQYVDDRKLGKKIFFTGASNQVKEILEQQDIFIMTSKDEGLPVAAQEAMSYEMPLILTDVGGCRELIHDNGFLIKPVIEDVIQALNYYLQNKQMIKEHGKKSKELFLEKFSHRKMIENYIELINEIS